MSFKHKIAIIIVLFVVVIGINLPLYAWLGKEAIPVPPDTEELNTETRRIGGTEFDFTYYTSGLSAAHIKKLYRRELPKLGWKEKDILKDMAQVPDFQASPELRSFLANNLTFQKDSQVVIINFTPEEVSTDGRTRFTISEGKMDLEAEVSPDRDFIPELLAEPGLEEFMPVYPGASLINIFEPPGLEQATYITRDDIKDVISFYKRHMPDYGWYLKKETPIAPLKLGEFARGDISKHCPTCPKDMAASLESIEMFTSELIFSDEKGQTCKIFLSNVVSKVESPYPIDMTTIVVNYGKGY